MILSLTKHEPPFFNKDERIEIKNIIIRDQGVLAYPTETFYGLGCRADSSEAVKRIFLIKKRPIGLPLLVLIKDWQMLEECALPLSQNQKKFLSQFWPGPLTVVLPSKGFLAPELNTTGGMIGFRMTSSPIAQELIKICGQPLVGTSANLSGQKELDEFGPVLKEFEGMVDLLIDGGKTKGGLPSTLIRFLNDQAFEVLRPGFISFRGEGLENQFLFQDNL